MEANGLDVRRVPLCKCSRKNITAGPPRKRESTSPCGLATKGIIRLRTGRQTIDALKKKLKKSGFQSGNSLASLPIVPAHSPNELLVNSRNLQAYPRFMRMSGLESAAQR